MRRPCVLLVEDEQAVREVVSAMLEGEFGVIAAKDGASALAALGRANPDLVISDVRLTPGEQGREVAQRAGDLRVPVILITGDTASASDLEGAGFNVLAKPFRSADLINRAWQAINGQRVGFAVPKR